MMKRLLLLIGVVAVAAAAGRTGSDAATTEGLLARANGDIALASGTSLVTIDPDTRTVRTISTCPRKETDCGIDYPAWSPTGRRLAFIRGTFAANSPSHASLYIATNGGAPRRLAACGSCGYWRVPIGLAWSPNGKWIAFTRENFYTGNGTLWIVRAAGGKPHRLTHCPGPGRCDDLNPSWSPNGHRLVYEQVAMGSGRLSNGLYTVRSNSTDPTEIAAGEDPQWSPVGNRIAFDSDSGIEVANADGSGAQLLYAQTGGAGPGVPSWSPDGKRLVFFNTPSEAGHYSAEVWTMNADGKDQQRLFSAGCCVSTWAAPIWSPDGTMIAFAASNAGGTNVVNADGTGLRRLSSTEADSLSWQPLPK